MQQPVGRRDRQNTVISRLHTVGKDFKRFRLDIVKLINRANHISYYRSYHDQL